MRDPMLSEGAAQRTFVKLARSRSYREEGKLDGLITRIAVNEARTNAGARRHSNREIEAEVAQEGGEPPVERMVFELTPADAADIDAAIRMLREERGQAVPVGSAVAALCRLRSSAAQDQDA